MNKSSEIISGKSENWVDSEGNKLAFASWKKGYPAKGSKSAVIRIRPTDSTSEVGNWTSAYESTDSNTLNIACLQGLTGFKTKKNF